MFNRHYNDLNSNNAKTANRLKLIPKQKWTQAFDKGRRWGHMITNLAEFIHLVLKGTRYLPITVIVKDIGRKLAILFAKRGWKHM